MGLAVLVAAILAAPWAHAQEEQEAGVPPGAFELHIPDRMMVNTQYEGVLIREGTDGSMIVHMASTDASVSIPSSVLIRDGYNHAIFPISATNSASRDIESDTITVNAVTAGRTETATASVYSGGGFGSKITLAGPVDGDGTLKTATDRVPIYVYLTDPYGIPVRAEDDIEVRLTTSGGVRLVTGTGGIGDSTGVTIPAGGNHATRMAFTSGDGTIYAAADGFQTDSMEVDYHDIEPPRVRIEVAPNVAVPNSYVHYYVWIEYDGTQYIPGDVIDVHVSTSDRYAARLDASLGGDDPQAASDDSTVWMVDGVARGIIYTGSPRYYSDQWHADRGWDHSLPGRIRTVDVDDNLAFDATISASIDGYGSDSAELWIGPYVSGGGAAELIEEAEECMIEQDDADGNAESDDGCEFLTAASRALKSASTAASSEHPDANSAMLWLYPESPRVSAYGVVGTYYEVAEITTDLAADEDSDESGFTITRSEGRKVIVPVIMQPGTEMDISGSVGLAHDGVVRVLSGLGPESRPDAWSDVPLSGDGLLQSSAEFAVTAQVPGSHHVTVQGSKIRNSPTVEFEAAGRYDDMRILVTELPSRLGEHGDIALVSVTDEFGYLVDPSGISDNVGILQEGDSISGLGIARDGASAAGTGGRDWAGSSARVSGVHGDRYAYVTTQIPGLGAERYGISPSGIPSGVSLWAPSTVHLSEEFPMVVHAVNDEGVPMGVLDGFTMSTDDVASSGGGSRFRANVDGTLDITLISDDTRHIASRVVEVFSNPSDDAVSVSFAEGSVPEDVPLDVPDGLDAMFRLGEGIVLNILAAGIIDPDIVIDSALSFEGGDGIWTADPEVPGVHDVVVTVSADGWDTHTESYRVGVIDLIDVSYEASTDDGLQVHTSVGLSPVWLEDEAYEIDSGYGMTLQPGIYQASVPQIIEVGEGHVYTLEGMEISGRPVQYAETFSVTLDSDALVQADYQRRIDVRFDNYYDSESVESSATSGSGKYRYGDTVTLEADIQYESGGLIWHVPSEWVGLPEGAALAGDMSTARFEAVEGAEGYVEYERSYMPVIAVAAATGIAVPVLLFRASPDILHDIRDVFSRLASRIPAPSIGRRGRAKAGAAAERQAREAGGQ